MDKTVLCYIQSGNRVLMLYKNKRPNDPNLGKWLGVGGHIEDGEKPEDAVKREIKEETGLIVLDYVKRGQVLFVNDDYQEMMYIYTVDNFVGSLIECDEGDLKWFDKSEVKNLNIWEGDKEFLDILFNEAIYFEMELYYSNGKLVRSVRIR